MVAVTPDRIRNVAVVGHGGSGKTTLSEYYRPHLIPFDLGSRADFVWAAPGGPAARSGKALPRLKGVCRWSQ